MDDIEEGLRVRLALTGEIDLTLPEGFARVSRLEMTSRGTFTEPIAPLRLKIEGTHEELRKLRALSTKIAGLLDKHPDEQGEGIITLVAPASHIVALREAAIGSPEMDGEAMLKNVPWMTLLLSLGEYEVESIGTITRGVELV